MLFLSNKNRILYIYIKHLEEANPKTKTFQNFLNHAEIFWNFELYYWDLQLRLRKIFSG